MDITKSALKLSFSPKFIKKKKDFKWNQKPSTCLPTLRHAGHLLYKKTIHNQPRYSKKTFLLNILAYLQENKRKINRYELIELAKHIHFQFAKDGEDIVKSNFNNLSQWGFLKLKHQAKHSYPQIGITDLSLIHYVIDTYYQQKKEE